MNQLPGYRLSEELYTGQRFVTYRGVRETDAQPVIVKTTVARRSSLRDNAKLRHEYEIVRGLDVEGVVRALAFEDLREQVLLVLEDFGGISLKQFQQGKPMDVATFCMLAIQCADVLGRVHAAGVIHKDVKPANLIVHPSSLEVRLTDFGIASRLSRESAQNRGPGRIEGTLAYISPEQTGRMNRDVDDRSDLYALGGTFYEMLTGRPPFESADPMELVFFHIAKKPRPPHEVVSGVPRALSDVVMKLLAKTAEERYQSAVGVKADLQKCLAELQETGRISELAVGAEDVAKQFRIPQKLYGRQSQLAALMDAFDRVAEGAVESLLVSGYSGIGKSALVGEIHRPITGRRGYFLHGKFDQLRRNIPYGGFIQAFQDLTRKLLTESADRIEQWRARLLEALAPNAQVIVEVVPEIELIIGPQPAAPQLGPSESQIRFNVLVRQFLRALAAPEHPLVIFLDDLQWADAASLNLIRLLLTDSELRHVLLIGAYRDNEVDASHPLQASIEELERLRVRLRQITLAPLALEHIEQLIDDTLHAPAREARALAELVLSKTHGNPFFVGQFLATLHAKGLLTLDPRLGRWVWDIERIRRENITDNVGELLAARIRTLGVSTRNMLQLAACVGSAFDLATLSMASEKPPVDVAADLSEALAAELITPIGDAYKYTELLRASAGGASETRIAYRFIHDRVQQAAYLSIPEEERPKLHLSIGYLLLQGSKPEAQEERLFDIVSHLNAAIALLRRPEERSQLAELNLRAARKAKQSTAYEPAMRHLKTGISLLGLESWDTHYELTFALHATRAETAFLSGDHAEMELLSSLLLQKARTELEQVRVLEMRINAYSSQMQWVRVVDVGLEALRLLGAPLPANPGKAHVVLALARTMAVLRGKSFDALRSLPDMTEPRVLEEMRILKLTAAAAYFTQTDLFALITFRLVQRSIRHGNTDLSAYGYMLYGLALCAVLGDFDNGYQFGRLAMDTLERFRANHLKAPLVMLYSAFIQHWKEPLTVSIRPLIEAAQAGLESGDLEYFSFDHYWRAAHCLYTAEHLSNVRAVVDRSLAVVSKQKQEKGTFVLLHLRHLVDALQGGPGASPPPEGDLPEEQIVERWRKARDYNALAYAYGYQGVACYFAGDFRGCVERMAHCDEHPDAIAAQSFVPFYLLYNALAHLALVPERSGAERARSLRRASAIRRSFTKWARHSPKNYAHRLHLIEAELGRVLGRPAEEVSRAYEQAIALARENGFTHDEALASELAGGYFLGRGLQAPARAYLMEARHLFQRWGATAHAAQLQARYPQLLAAGAGSAWGASDGPDVTQTTSSGGPSSRDLDLQSIVRAAQAISGEIVLAELLRKLMRILVENAGAQRGVLLLSRGGGMAMAAEATADGGPIELFPSGPAVGARLPGALVNYCMRTREHVVLADATREERFANDPYIAARQPRSVLCSPLIQQGKVAGVIYLENSLTPGAFTRERLELVQVLSSQAGISLRNAELYSDLEKALATQVELTTAHSRFVPHQFLQSLNRANIVDVRLGDHVEKEISILFSDIRGFTRIAEALRPEETLEFVNTYLSQIEPPILEAGGFIDNYTGDGVMALFDGPTDRVLRGAIAMHHALERYNRERVGRGQPLVRTGVGINTGKVMLGTIGGQARMACGVIGDAVNLASRVESLTKRYGSAVLVTEHTVRRLEAPEKYSLRRVERVRVFGKTEPVTLYEVLDAETTEVRALKKASLARFERALDRYYAREFEAAQEVFERCRGDPVASLYAQRCRNYLQSGVDAGWDGIEQLNEK